MEYRALNKLNKYGIYYTEDQFNARIQPVFFLFFLWGESCYTTIFYDNSMSRLFLKSSWLMLEMLVLIQMNLVKPIFYVAR